MPKICRLICLKVIKIKTPEEMGNKLIVQGGTFYNDAILRCFEIISEREAVRPDIAGLMGAYGCALIAKNSYNSAEIKPTTTLLSLNSATSIKADVRKVRCGKCTNNCLLTINKFSDGKIFMSGNRCEKGDASNKNSDNKDLREKLNLFSYKYKRHAASGIILPIVLTSFIYSYTPSSAI